MRLLVKLKCQNNYVYDKRYYHKLQGFLYNILKDSEYQQLHDKKGYKFFSFSNIFPIENNRYGTTKNLIIASPNEKFIDVLKQRFEELKSNDKTINIGEMLFKVYGLTVFKSRIRNNSRLISATPIIVRIPSYMFGSYGIESNKRYVYWRKEYSFECFVKQLNENLIKKYNEFHNSDVKDVFLFEQFVFKKTTANHVVVDGKEYKFIGSVWEFIFSYLDREQKRILQFGIDTGFGERNSFGFGFVNVVNSVSKNS